MGWSLGGPDQWGRFVGYGVPCYCDHPGCRRVINRGLAYVCCNQEPFGGDKGCGLYFCGKHADLLGRCERCRRGRPSFTPKPEHSRWLLHLLVHSSWREWRAENPRKVTSMRRSLAQRRRRKAA